MIVIVVLCYCIWNSLASSIYEWYFNSERTQWFRELYILLNDRAWVNIPLCLVIIYFCVLGLIKLWKDEDIRPYRVGGIVLLLMFLNIKCEAIYPRIIGNFSYDVFFNFLLSTFLITTICRFFINILAKISKAYNSKEDSAKYGFTVDNEHKDILPDNMKKYGETLADQLLSTIRRNKQSIAVGITGEWGSGKTTFLNLLKNNLNERVEIVDFNPWMCQTPEQVTRDFFASLRHQLSHKHSSLSKPISHYAKYLDRVRISVLGSIWLESANIAKIPSLLALKEELSSKFMNLDKPVVVFIDDLDRLENKEVFEVLRLIRNTGDINNTIYVTTFDKEYVTSVLRGIGCNTPSEYLEKIFPIELHLPKPEGYQIWEVFKEELSLQDSTERRFAENLVNSFSPSDSELILRILTNYRKVKRFSRVLMLNVNFVSRYYLRDFKYLDLFWIELLQFYDSMTYDSLARNALTLLYYDSTTRRYMLREGIAQKISSTEESHHYTEEKIWQLHTPDILERLFGKYVKTTSMSLCYIENYMKFFALGLSAHKLSVNEVRHLIENKSDYKHVIDDWIKQGKYISSIEYNLIHIKTNTLTDAELENYLKGALYYGLIKQSWQNRNLGFLNTILAKTNFHNEKIAHDIVEKWINEEIIESDNLISLTGILRSLYATKEYDIDNPDKFTMQVKILSNNEIEATLAKIARTYLERHRLTASPLDILKKETELFKLFDNCSVETECIPLEGSSHYIQTSFDDVIQFFGASHSKPTVEEYESYMTELYHEDEPDPGSFDNPNDYYEWQEYEGERYDNRMSRHFGSRYDDSLKKFKGLCFYATNASNMESEENKRNKARKKKKSATFSSRKTPNKRKGKSKRK